ncbi:hypothetical protein OJF2_03040 [Aquisphaera giovannonii]|uniref:Fibronectin type-III domain-containing protein n=1 Tax=Aquisphaera giovannonii TaxID=406548 RepID=A0A5B9VUQ8_9BACT|nr:fibronectin type III domain-containing protein [Aquisphaera giovannonii]QEH31839.1 hypothetical protein OJF2_03040 [Aquisphaera giovannonii]
MSRRPRRFVPEFSSRLERRLLLKAGAGRYGEYLASIAQDGSDMVAPAAGTGIQADGFSDIHLTVKGIPAAKTITSVTVATSDDVWGPGHYEAYFVRTDATTCDVYVESPHTGPRTYAVTLSYFSDADGDGVNDIPGDSSHSGTADISNTTPFQVLPPPRAVGPSAPALSVTDLGYGSGSEDIANASSSPGADGRADYRLAINGILAGYNQVSTVPGGSSAYGNYVTLTDGTNTWSSQPTWPDFARPAGSWDAELIPGADYYGTSTPPNQQVLFFQLPAGAAPPGDMVLTVYYIGGLTDTCGPFSLKDRGSAPAASQPNPFALTNVPGLHASWAGQTTAAVAGAKAGSVKVALDGLPATAISSMVLSNATAVSWVYANDAAPSNVSAFNLPLYYQAGAIYFAPDRSESGSTLSLRIHFADGTTTYLTFAGGPVDFRLYDPAPSSPSSPVVAGPDDVSSSADPRRLETILNTAGYVELTAGVYDIPYQVVISHPVRVIADPGVTLRFTTGGRAWDSLIRIEASHVQLDGFAVGVADAYRCSNNLYDPSAFVRVAGSGADMMVDVRLTNLVLRQSAVAPGSDPNGLVGFRSGPLTSGVVDSVTFIGQAALIAGGPWRVTNSDYQGALAGADVYQAFTTRDDAHDLVIANNRVHQAIAGGITRRFLYMRAATDTAISGNAVYGGIGSPAAGSGWPNTPESLLTDDTDPFYVGVPASVSGDGYLLKVNTLRTGDAPAPGDVVSILDPSYSGGRWFRIAQVLDAHTYLMLDPLPAGLNTTISIAYGYFHNTIDHNTWDFAGTGMDARNISVALYGAQFDVSVTNNVIHAAATGNGAEGTVDSILVGGSRTQPPPGARGTYPAGDMWAQLPCFEVTVSGNLLEDANPIRVFSTGDRRVRDTSDLLFFEGTLADNTSALSVAYLAGAGVTARIPTIEVGDPYVVNTAQYTLTITGNAAVLPPGASTVGVIRYNGGLAGSPAEIALTSAPAAPTGPAAKANSVQTVIDVSWTATAGAGATLIERSPDGLTGWTQVATVAAGTSTYRDADVVAGRSYSYRVRTRGDVGTSPYSATSSATAGSPAVLTVRSLNQDGSNYVQQSPGGGAGTDTIQDVHLALSGLGALPVATIDLTGQGGRWQYNAPFGSSNTNGVWRAELVRTGLSSVASLYFEAAGPIAPGEAFTVTVTYADGSTQTATFSGVSVTNPDLRVPGVTVPPTTTGQSGGTSTSSPGTSSPGASSPGTSSTGGSPGTITSTTTQPGSSSSSSSSSGVTKASPRAIRQALVKARRQAAILRQLQKQAIRRAALAQRQTKAAARHHLS